MVMVVRLDVAERDEKVSDRPISTCLVPSPVKTHPFEAFSNAS